MREDLFVDMLEKRVGENEGREGWGRFNGMVRWVSEWLGVHPWRVLGPISIVVAIGMAFVLRGWLVGLVRVLQRGW